MGTCKLYPNNIYNRPGTRRRIRYVRTGLPNDPLETDKDGILPPGLIQVWYGGCDRNDAIGSKKHSRRELQSIVFQRPPHKKTVRISSAPKAGVRAHNTRSFTLLLPWTLYVVGEASAMVMAMDGAFDSAKATYPLMFPNMYRSGMICHARDDFNNHRDSVIKTMEETYSAIWDTGFNLDTSENLMVLWDRQRQQRRKSYTSEILFDFYSEWEELRTLKDVEALTFKTKGGSRPQGYIEWALRYDTMATPGLMQLL